jgi:hypothetical protein
MPIHFICTTINEKVMQNSNLSQKISSFTLTLTMLATLISCGGGGSSGGSGESSTSTGSVNATESDSEVRDMGDLEISRASGLSTVSRLNIEIEMSTGRSYLSVCPEPAGEIEVNTLDYNSCMIRAPINASRNVFKLDVPNHLDSLVAVLWYYDTKKAPFVSRWQRNSAKGAAFDSSWNIIVPD